MLRTYGLVFVSLVFSITHLVISESYIVNTTNGPIQGKQKSLPNPQNSPYLEGRDLTYTEYLGIPYAEPPVGNLRFRPPQPLKRTWSTVRNATTHGAGCMQHKTRTLPPQEHMSEDCLYLDVWTPGNVSNSDPKAVMVWIHGGGYSLLSTSVWDGVKHTVIGDVIVVMMNYRLDIFGFLSTGGNDVVPGNMGLLDQQFAIRWVKDNIALFGGDPERITLFGESAGASSVTQHAISPSNMGLFQRIISQSGTIFTEYAFHHNDMPKSVRKIGESLNCTSDNSIKLIECLRDVEPEALLEASRPPPDALDIIWRWNPVVDGTFIIKEPRDLRRKRRRGPSEKMLGSVDVMVGHNSDEGYRFLQIYALSQDPEFVAFNSSWNNVSFLRPALEKVLRRIGAKYGDGEVAEKIYETVAYTYLGIHKGEDLNDERLAEIAADIITDEWLLIPTLRFANLHAGLGGRTFKYHFVYRPSTSLHPEWVKGADHDAEYHLQFGQFPADPVDQLVSYTLITYWSNFAKTGNPNEPVANPPLMEEWPQFTSENNRYLEISANTRSSKPGEIIKTDRVHFWMEYLQEIAKCKKLKSRIRPAE